MKRTGLTILLAALFILLVSASVPAGETADMKSPESIFSAEFEGGKLYHSGEIRVVELTGNYRQMGRASAITSSTGARRDDACVKRLANNPSSPLSS